MNTREVLEKELTELGRQASENGDEGLRGRIEAIIDDLTLPAGKEYAYKVLPEVRRAVKRLVGRKSQRQMRTAESSPGIDTGEIENIVA